MAVALGFLLIPVGAFIGTAIVFVSILLLDPASVTVKSTYLLWYFGLLFGAIFAAPVTAIILPLAYAVIRRTSGLSATKISAVGLLSGILPVWAFVALERQGTFDPTERGVLLMSAVGALSGLVVGMAFAMMMKRWRPTHWSTSGAGRDNYNEGITG